MSGTIVQRMHAVRERMRLERISGIVAADKALFLAMCQDLDSFVEDERVEDESGWNGMNWSDFGDWNDSPAFARER